MADLQSKLARGDFVITAEITPPLSASAADLVERVRPLEGLADAVNVTDAPSARTTLSSFASAVLLQQNGIEPVLQMTCRDRNRIAIASELLGASALGIHNLLVLRGDDPSAGDQPEAKPVFDLESKDLLALASHMCDTGTMPSGREIRHPPQLHLGCADAPLDPPEDFQPHALTAKIEAGARFAQTQFCYDLGIAERYFQALRRHGITERLKFIVGIGPLASARSARWMNENLFGVSIPDSILERMDKASDEQQAGREICIEAINGLQQIEGVSGVHIMAPQQGAKAVAATIRASGLR